MVDAGVVGVTVVILHVRDGSKEAGIRAARGKKQGEGAAKTLSAGKF